MIYNNVEQNDTLAPSSDDDPRLYLLTGDLAESYSKNIQNKQSRKYLYACTPIYMPDKKWVP